VYERYINATGCLNIILIILVTHRTGSMHQMRYRKHSTVVYALGGIQNQV
jgi:hypothetical protein